MKIVVFPFLAKDTAVTVNSASYEKEGTNSIQKVLVDIGTCGTLIKFTNLRSKLRSE